MVMNCFSPRDWTPISPEAIFQDLQKLQVADSAAEIGGHKSKRWKNEQESTIIEWSLKIYPTQMQETPQSYLYMTMLMAWTLIAAILITAIVLAKLTLTRNLIRELQ